ncbi:MAG: nickel-dependent hydrogenase large subunit [Piscinibacter sp.]|uniref:nickel-dependent hydrogenase large subunit n=1 Tax=Piscinibacter sp. TaxID=1903157 RepID=UPI00258C469F|nr:nickel-dependent hydrogenase large subunit [Piscinibacter sp.]MCW5665896.1 nickel-dependent hydrogenase large subunit [Piscinibacter sp.]
MSRRVVVDPITRIEGHLRIEAETAADGRITGAWSSGTMVRGIELILRGRDPREAWAFAQRICGVCTLVHGMASIRAVEDALQWRIPANANLIRNLMVAAQHVHDHVMHFYHLHALDWVDVVSALKADPKTTSALAQSISGWPKSSPGYFADTQKKLRQFVEQGQLGIFAGGFWGHPEYKLPPEANLMAVAHYLEALAWQREVVKLQAIFGGKNPHPNFLVGGAASPISAAPGSGGAAATTLNVVTLGELRQIIQSMRTFVDQVYLPDTLAIAGFYKDWFARGEGLGNFLTVGDFPSAGGSDPSTWLIPSGVILGRDLQAIEPVDLRDPQQVQEFVAHSWYEYAGGKSQGLHPHAGETKLAYTGPKPPYEQLDVEGGYSWLKSPRWRGKAVEVGPLARLVMLYAKGHEPTRALADQALRTLELPLAAIFSTLGRTAARAIESKVFADQMTGWLDQLIANIKAGELSVHNDALWEPSRWPREARGVGFMEAPRGALCHYVVIKDGLIDNYQAVVPSTWNAGPRDATGQPGAYEAALMDRHHLHDPKQPLEIQRTVHSFDPCIACAVHVLDPQGEELTRIRVR